VYDIPLLGQAFIWSFETKARFGGAKYLIFGKATWKGALGARHATFHL
jgi:hypothetical protein